MVSVRKYPSTVVSGGTGLWTTPDNVKVEDGACAEHYTRIICDSILTLSGFGFDLPADAIIDKVTIGMHSLLANSVNLNAQLTMYLWCDWPSIMLGAVTQQSYDCANCIDYSNFADWSVVYHFDADDFNNEEFTCELHAASTFNNGFFWRAKADACWIEVTYHVPAPPPTGSHGNLATIFVACLQAWRHRRRKRRSITTVK